MVEPAKITIARWVRENFSPMPESLPQEKRRLYALSRQQGFDFDRRSLSNAIRGAWLKCSLAPGQKVSPLRDPRSKFEKTQATMAESVETTRKPTEKPQVIVPYYYTPEMEQVARDLTRRRRAGEEIDWRGPDRDPREVSWITGNLAYKLRPHGQTRLYRWIHKWQEENPDDPGPLLVCAHRRFGKGFTSFLLGAEYACRWPRMRIRIFSPSKEQGVDIGDDVWPDVLEDLPPDVALSEADGGLRFFNPHWRMPSGEQCDPDMDRSLVVLHGTETKLGRRGRGVGSNIIIIDEAQEMENFDKVLRRVIGPQVMKKEHALVLILFTAPHGRHPLNEYYIPEAIQDKRIFFQSLSADEDFTETEIRAAEKIVGRRDSLNWRIEMECEWQLRDDSASLILPEWSYMTRQCQSDGVKSDMIWTDEYQLPDYYYPMVAVDWSYSNYTSVLFHYWHWEAKKWIICRELWTRGGRNTPDMLKLIRDTAAQVFPNPKHEVRYHMDLSNEQQSADVRRIWKFYFTSADKTDRMVTLAALNVMIASREITVHSSCKALLRQLEFGSFRDEKNEKVASDFRDDPTNFIGDLDALDALRYGWKAMRGRKTMDPNPEKGQYVGHQWIPDEIDDAWGNLLSEEVMG